MATQHFVSLGLIAAAAALGASSASAYTFYGSFADWSAATETGSVSTETFEGYSAGADLFNKKLDAIANVRLTTNLERLTVFNSSYSVNKVAFASSRDLDASGVIASFSTPVTAFSFEIHGWNRHSPGPSFLYLQFADNLEIKVIAVEKLFGNESDPFFVGITDAVRGLKRVGWREGPELDGTCCEEVGWDNISQGVARVVPELNTYAYLAGGLCVTAWLASRRRRSQG